MALLRDLDWPGLAYAAIGFGLLYAGLDQGNRLDWTGSGVVNGLLLSGGVMTIGFVVRELVTPRPFLNLRLLLRENLPYLLLLLAGFRFIILSTAYIIPNYLQNVQNFRELQVGVVLLWIALPQFLIVWPLAVLLRRVDGRWVLAFGTATHRHGLPHGDRYDRPWATADFLPSQIMQAIGQSFALTALIVLMVRSINPTDALTIGSLLQISRLFGGEVGTAFMQTFVRVREQVHSNLIGLHIAGGTAFTTDRLAAYAGHLRAYIADPGFVNAQALPRSLAMTVVSQAKVLAYQGRVHSRRNRPMLLPAARRPHAAGTAFFILIRSYAP